MDSLDCFRDSPPRIRLRPLVGRFRLQFLKKMMFLGLITMETEKRGGRHERS
jgi:hypothetical protein